MLSFDELQAMRRKEFGFVYQNYRLLPELTIEENMILPALLDHQELDQVWIEKLLIDLGLQKLKNRKPAQTSGGEQQRCALARALFNRPEILFLDEPTGNLDKKNRNDVMRLLQSIHAHHQCTMILVTHDLEIARTADILLKMEDGYILQLTAGEEECETN